MSHHETAQFCAEFALPVLPAEGLFVNSGVNAGETLASPSAINPGDTYILRRDNAPSTLLIGEVGHANGAAPLFKVLDGSAVETPGVRVRAAALLTFLTPAATRTDALVLQCDGPAPRSYLHALGPIEPGVELSLIDVTHNPAHLPVGETAGLSFGRGTHITMSDGSQRKVEKLAIGDRVLTRDNGMQAIRWIGRRTVPASGRFAPVVISPGVFDNDESLTVGQTHRILLSDWRAEVLVGSRDVLISALDMVDDDKVYVRPGGFLEYTQIVFDRHQLIYAEGIATESLNVSPELLSLMPSETAQEILSVIPDLTSRPAISSRVPLDSAKAQTLLREAGRLR